MEQCDSSRARILLSLLLPGDTGGAVSCVLGDTTALPLVSLCQELQLCHRALLQLIPLKLPELLPQEFPVCWEELQVLPKVSLPPSLPPSSCCLLGIGEYEAVLSTTQMTTICSKTRLLYCLFFQCPNTYKATENFCSFFPFTSVGG